MFVPARYYGNPHSDNGSPDTQEAFYFVVEGRREPDERSPQANLLLPLERRSPSP
jgi:hypothetical protein